MWPFNQAQAPACLCETPIAQHATMQDPEVRCCQSTRCTAGKRMGPHFTWNGAAAQINVDSMPLGPDNPHGVGFVATETEFRTEQEAIREVDPRRSRVWKIKNEAARNVNTGSRLLPFTPLPCLCKPCMRDVKPALTQFCQ